MSNQECDIFWRTKVFTDSGTGQNHGLETKFLVAVRCLTYSKFKEWHFMGALDTAKSAEKGKGSA